jgi:alkylglycerol monooxygenase
VGGISAAVAATGTPTIWFELDSNETWTWIAAFVSYDFCYYWSHRFSHELRILWATHVVHHQSEAFNLSTALRQPSTGFLSFVFFLPLFAVGFPRNVLLTVGSLNLIYQFWVHTEHIRTLGPLEWVLITPSNHRVHHARNPEYLDRNYGGVFIVWDRLFRTFTAEDPKIPCSFGITHPIQSLNPLWANLHVWYENFKDAWNTRRITDKVRIWFSSPTWRPADLRDSRIPAWSKAAFSEQAPQKTRTGVFVQMVLLIAGLMILRYATLDRALALALLFFAILSFHVEGMWLENRRSVRIFEFGRLAAVALAAWYGFASAHTRNVPLAVGLGIYVLASAAVSLCMPSPGNRPLTP